MADTKISDLPDASTLTGTETIPLVQSGVTKKATSAQPLALASQRGLLSARPSAGIPGRKYTTTDDIQADYRDNGSSWDQVGVGLNDPLLGWQMLGVGVLGSNANTLTAITIAARDEIMVVVRLVGYDTADTCALRFNGDTGTNYNSRHMSVAVAGTTWSNQFNSGDTMVKLAPSNSVRSRSFSMMIGNHATSYKQVAISSALGGSGATNEPIVSLSSGGWFNLADQITSVQLITTGANNMLTGTGIAIYGRNFS